MTPSQPYPITPHEQRHSLTRTLTSNNFLRRNGVSLYYALSGIRVRSRLLESRRLHLQQVSQTWRHIRYELLRTSLCSHGAWTCEEIGGGAKESGWQVAGSILITGKTRAVKPLVRVLCSRQQFHYTSLFTTPLLPLQLLDKIQKKLKRSAPLLWFFGTKAPLEEAENEKDGSSKTTASFSTPVQFMFCFMGLQVSYLSWGYFQERIMTVEYGTYTQHCFTRGRSSGVRQHYIDVGIDARVFFCLPRRNMQNSHIVPPRLAGDTCSYMYTHKLTWFPFLCI